MKNSFHFCFTPAADTRSCCRVCIQYKRNSILAEVSVGYAVVTLGFTPSGVRIFSFYERDFRDRSLSFSTFEDILKTTMQMTFL